MATSPITQPTPSIATRLLNTITVWILKAMVRTVFGTCHILGTSTFKAYAPTQKKRYPVRPMLECRVYIPKNHKAGSSHPLLIDIHGGGFIIGDPWRDDKVCHYLCNKFNFVVVSIQYHLAPLHPYPTGVEDCTELALAIISDPALPINRDKVAICGSSAGGNMTLAASQDNRLRSKLKGLIVLYPVTDFSNVYSGDVRDKPGEKPDNARRFMHLMPWSYIPYGQDRTNPRLSPVYADSSMLPKRIYFLTAQYDMLCQEAFHMAKTLAQHDTATEEEDWDVNGIRWERVPDEKHGFIEADWVGELFGRAPGPWRRKVEDVLDRLGEWLVELYRS